MDFAAEARVMSDVIYLYDFLHFLLPANIRLWFSSYVLSSLLSQSQSHSPEQRYTGESEVICSGRSHSSSWIYRCKIRMLD